MEGEGEKAKGEEEKAENKEEKKRQSRKKRPDLSDLRVPVLCGVKKSRGKNKSRKTRKGSKSTRKSWQKKGPAQPAALPVRNRGPAQPAAPPEV
jgi:hypothetical protein